MIHHVVFVVNNYPPKIGGVERHVSSLVTELASRGVRVTVVTLSDHHGDVDEAGIRVIREPGWLSVGDVFSLPRPGFARRLRRIIGDPGVTAVWTHTRFFPLSFSGVRAARRLDVPVVHTEHGSDFVRGVSPLVALASRLVDMTLGRSVLRGADRVVAVSERVAAFVQRLAGVDSRVVYNAIDTELWIAARRPARDRLVFVGRLVSGKGWELLLDAVALLAPTRKVEVDVFGDGPDMAALLARRRELGLDDLVTAHGRTEIADLAPAVAGAVLVNPTTLAEGFQTSIIEVLAAGGRVVTFDVAGAGVLAADGAPVAVLADQSIPALAAGITTALDYPAASYPEERARGWDWGARADEYLALLVGLPARGRRGRVGRRP